MDKVLRVSAVSRGFAFLLLWLAGVACFAVPPLSQKGFDGPAELPRVYLKTAMADTPTPGHVLRVRPSESLQRAVDQAKCGDILMLEPGAVYSGTVQFPAKNCDDGHWILLRTGVADDKLPREGSRMTPCYGGVTGLPARPALHCTTVSNVLAKIEFDGKGGSGPILFMNGANHYRFTGLEIRRGNPGAPMTALASAKENASAHHIIFDRVWMHGTAEDETARGVAFTEIAFGALVDSYLNDFHCIAVSGACTDAQAVGSGGGVAAQGPYKIVNNFLEASGENILFGGKPAEVTPTDIEIRRNHLFKPMTWMKDQPGYVGGTSGHPFIVKNHFEVKNAQRVLFEGNLLENVWGGFSQTGFSILLTPKNQANKCPLCKVTDITVRYNRVRNVGSVLQLANALSDAGGASTAGERYSIHDLVADGVHQQDYQGFGIFALILSNKPQMRDVSIDHNTVFVPNLLISILDKTEKLANFTIANNIFSAPREPKIASAGGGPGNCAYRPEGQGPGGVFKSCFENSTFTHNLILGGQGSWPPGNFLVKDMGDAGIREDYRLCRKADASASCKRASLGLAAGRDGKDIGADMEEIETALQGVE